MKKIIIVLLSVILSITIFAGTIVVDINSNIKIFLKDSGTYTVHYNGNIVKDKNGRRILLKPNKTWDYLGNIRNQIVNNGEIYINRNGRWGYLRKNKSDNFPYMQVSLTRINRSKTLIEGKILNNSKFNYKNSTFNIVVFDKKSFEYKVVGRISTNRFLKKSKVRFSKYININKSDILEYYIEYVDGEKFKFLKTRKIKRTKAKTLGDYQKELND
ncbi:hypothetical protein [Haliovirga abyssi]|uniref:WG repeat-containing protein n=1 Tax=Haliovirga abyssi TaxID=2996794 RepID=A0AAU9D242_9FUSO|nr:hypothetical protein [Haliovirga abyssi]BDU50066.1 hypothetical protein HLVA_06350 [Haliovirga abyssi]